MYDVRWPRFKTEEEAIAALKNLDEIFNEYGKASVADLYESCGDFSSIFSDNSWGWTDKTLFDIAESSLEFGFEIIGPDPIKFDLKEIQMHQPIDNVSRHSDICKELNELYERKNHDYGDSFHETWLEEGYGMARIRLSDKLSRFKQLTKSYAKVMDESVRDTLIDLANYAIMTVMEMDREKEGKTDG